VPSGECRQGLHRLEGNGLLEVVSRRKDQTTVLLVVPDLNQLMSLSLSSRSSSRRVRRLTGFRVSVLARHIRSLGPAASEAATRSPSMQSMSTASPSQVVTWCG